MRHFLIILILGSFFYGKAQSQVDSLPKWAQKLANPDRRWVVTPVFYYTPETQWAFGGAAVGFFQMSKNDTVSPLSNGGISFAYTQNDQILFRVPFNLYWKQNRYRLLGDIDFYRFPYFFAGIGNDFPPDYSEDYSASFPRVQAQFLRRVKGNLFTGPSVFLQNTTIDQVEAGGLLESGNVPGSEGGVSNAIGWEFMIDSRDNVYASRKGHYLRFGMLFFDQAFASDFSFNHFILDLRKFFNLGKNHIIAIQGYGEYNFGETPFNRMGQLGGPKRMRGYKLGALRDQHYTTAQMEYRTPFWKAFGLAAFIGTGAVSSTIETFSTNDLKPSYGAGLRVAFNKEKRIHLRLDYARGADRDELYFTVTESF